MPIIYLSLKNNEILIFLSFLIQFLLNYLSLSLIIFHFLIPVFILTKFSIKININIICLFLINKPV